MIFTTNISWTENERQILQRLSDGARHNCRDFYPEGATPNEMKAIRQIVLRIRQKLSRNQSSLLLLTERGEGKTSYWRLARRYTPD